jgi:rhodanese-related sulfurtransferase
VGSRAAKEALFEALASVGKALSSGRRAEIVDLLAQGERSVEDVAAELDQSVANTSHHLRNLARAGLVRTRREGTRVFYGLASEHVLELWTVMRAVAAEHIAEVDRLAQAYLGPRDGLEPITRDELTQRIRRGEVTVIDVRPAAEYEAGHVKGARSLPIGELTRRLEALPPDADVVAYCRGPYCVYADRAVEILKAAGRRAARLAEGFPEWQVAGLPVATGATAGTL